MIDTKIDAQAISWACKLGEALAEVRQRIWFISCHSDSPTAISAHCAVAKTQLRKAIQALDMIQHAADEDAEQHKRVILKTVGKP